MSEETPQPVHASTNIDPDLRVSHKPRRLLVPSMVVAIAGTSLLVGFFSGYWSSSTVDRTPEACAEALSDSADVIYLAGESLTLAADAIGYAATWDSYGLDRVNGELDIIKPDYDTALENYESKSGTCLDTAKEDK